MKIYYLYIIVIIFSEASSFTLQGQKLELTNKITDCIINNRYSDAISIIENIPPKLSEDPLFSVLKLSALGMRDVDFEKIIDSTAFLKSFDDAEKDILLFKQSGKSSDSSYVAMLTGLTKAIHAAYYLRQKKYLAAMKNGFSAMDEMKKAQNSDPENYEVDFFLGLYEFARSELRSKLWWVLFWYPGNRAEGIRRVERCAEKGLITSDAAKISLCDMYIQNKEGNKAHKVLGKLKKSFPQSRFVLWAEAKCFESEKNFYKAAKIYDTLSASYKNEEYGIYNSLFTLSKKAHMLYKSGEMESAKLVCNNILSEKRIGESPHIRKDIRKLMEKCNVSEN